MSHRSGPIDTSTSAKKPIESHISYQNTTPNEDERPHQHSSVSSYSKSLKRQQSHTASVQQKLSHLRNVFGAIRQNLQDDSQSV